MKKKKTCSRTAAVRCFGCGAERSLPQTSADKRNVGSVGKRVRCGNCQFFQKAEGDYSSRHKQTRKICLNAESKINFHFDTKKIKNLTLAFAGRFERVEILDYKVGGGKVVDLTERLEQKRSGTVLTVNLTKPVNIRAGYAFNEKNVCYSAHSDLCRGIQAARLSF